MPILRVENLAKIFGNDPKKAIKYVQQGLNRDQIREETGQTIGIADVNFEVKKGEILVVMGLSGSGKSTLVRCINRLIKPTYGNVFIDDEDVTKMNHKQLLYLRRHKVGMVFQNFGLFPHRTVLQNAEYGLEVMGIDPAERTKKALDALELVGLKGWEHQIPEELSGGMQQRVGLARALAVDPEIILMDEALSALDPLIRKDMQNELIDLQRKLHKTIVFITHDLDEAINMGDRIVLMKDGKVVQKGTAEEILTNPASRYVERFVEDVEMSKILTADSVMKKIHEVAYPNDGPRTVLHKIRESGHSAIFVVDAHGVIQGLITAKKASEYVNQDKKDNEGLIDTDFSKVSTQTPLADIVPLMAENKLPVAVVDKQNKLKGVIVVGSLLAGLAEGR
jgi:glycine betaine/proline transport system ATP-binding protein